jgi:hypothetical protein
MSTPGDRLKTIRENRGYETAKDAALAMGVPIATYTHHEKADRHLPARRAAEYAEFFKTTPEFLLYGKGDDPVTCIPIIGANGADTGRRIGFPTPPTTITQAQEALAGDGIAHFGLVALYDQPQRKTMPKADGRLWVVCVLEAEEERRLVRMIQPGSKPDLFHLISPAGGLPMTDQSVTWAAPVTALIPVTSAPE